MARYHAVRRLLAALARPRHLPLRIRLIAGFAAAMLVVLTGAGTFVYLRVQYALDLRLDENLTTQSAQLTDLIHAGTLPANLTGDTPTPAGGYFQVLDTSNHVLAGSRSLSAQSLLNAADLDRALHEPVRKDRGRLLPISPRPLRLYAVPLRADTPPPGRPAVALVAVRRDQRDEALRELIAQLTLANLAALAIASLVGYRLTRAALAPVERYRTEAARIADGATGVRLAVPPTAHDEVARLGHTLNDMLTALEAALARERRFINDASHELRTPLTLLSAELELALRRPRSTAELEQTIHDAVADTANLINLADTLLTIGAQSAQDRDAPLVDLSPLLSELLDRYQATTGTPLNTTIEPRLVTQGDPTRLRQVVTNLLDNAARHGAAPISVAATAHGPLVALTVHDHGPGMDPQFLPRATERFSRADTARATPGTGLGLSLVEAVTRAHRGHLRLCAGGAHHHTDPHVTIACAHPGAGTTATVLLPASAQTETAPLTQKPIHTLDSAVSGHEAAAPLEAS